MRMINDLKGAKTAKCIHDLRHLVKSSAECFGDRAFYLYKDGAQFTEYSFNKLLGDMNCIGTAFSILGVLGSVVAVCGDTHPLYTASYLATVNGGGCIVPIDKELSDDAIADFLEFSKAEVFIYTSAKNETVRTLTEKLSKIRYFIAIQPDPKAEPNDRFLSMKDMIALGQKALTEGDTSYLDVKLDMEKVCSLIFTSGTTGTSKGVMLSQKNLTAAINASCLSTPYDDQNVFLSVLPPHHTYEMTTCHLSTLNIGATVVLNDSLKHLMKNLAKFKPNALLLVPLFVETMHKKIWDEAKKKGKIRLLRASMKACNILLSVGVDMRKTFFSDITKAFGGNLKSIVCGGAPLSPDLISDFYTFGITILEGYGITECAPLVAVNRAGEVRLHSVGTPVMGCTVKIDKANATDEFGEILVKGDNVMLGYYENPEATAEVFTPDGWFRTGDLGYLDDDGYIFITGRKKNVIILSNGKNVFPEELEEYLAGVPEILESVVLTRQNEQGEETITAILVPNKELLADKTDDEIYAFLKDAVNHINQKLPSFKQMRKIEIRNEPFERTTSKKIQRFKVK